MKPIKGQTRADWMKAAVPHFVSEGMDEEAATKQAAELYAQEGQCRSGDTMAFKASIRATSYSVDEIKSLCKARGIVYEDGDEKYCATFEISNERVDRDGDIVMQEGIDMKNYRANPVVLFAHDYSGIPVGSSLSETLDKSDKANPKIIATVLFQRKTEMGRNVCDLALKRVIRAVSISFRPKMNGIKFPTEKERSDMGMRPGGVIILQAEMYEFSLCSIPANPYALARETAKSLTPSARNWGKSVGLIDGEFDGLDEEQQAESAEKAAEAEFEKTAEALIAKHPALFGVTTEDEFESPELAGALSRLEKAAQG